MNENSDSIIVTPLLTVYLLLGTLGTLIRGWTQLFYYVNIMVNIAYEKAREHEDFQ